MAENENYVLAPGGIPAQFGENADKWKAIFAEEINADGITTLQREKAYTEGNIAHHAGLKSQFYLVCTKAGTTSSNPLDVSSATLGASLPDGTVTWKVAQICDVNSLPAAAKSGSYNDLKDKPTIPSYSAATQSANGLMSAADKKKLDGIATGANAYSHPTSSGNKHIPSGGSAGQFLKWSADGTAVWAADNNTTYSNMTAATASAAGKAGLVPAPAAGAQGKYLRGDGTWQTPPDTNTTYSAATQSANGLMSAADKKKLDGIATGANAYSHPTSSGNKHIPSGGSSGQILRWSADGTATWGADNNTTYSNFVKSGTGAKAGLVPAPSTTAGTTKYLREDGTWTVPPDNNTTYSNMTAATASAAGKAGLVPAPAAGAQGKYLRGDGTWQTPTDTNTWRGIQNNLTSDSTTDSLSAAQGKVLKGLVDGKAASSHTHNYAGSSSAGGAATKAVGDKNGKDITTTYGTVDLNNLSAKGRKTFLPSSTFVSIGISSSSKTYTAPANGYIQCDAVTSEAAGWCYITAKNSGIITNNQGAVIGAGLYCYLPVSKGEIATFLWGNLTSISGKFIYAEGEVPV